MAFISFKNIKAQDITSFKIEQIRQLMSPIPHVMGPGHHNMMIENCIQLLHQPQQTNTNIFSANTGNNTIDTKNSIFVSIIFGASSRTTDAYKPNHVYIKEGQTIICTNNDNYLHTVTQKAYSNSASDNDDNRCKYTINYVSS